MAHAIVFDCEFLTRAGALARHWCGPGDPDPLLVQIGLVRLELDGAFEVTDQLRLHVVPLDRAGRRCPLDPFFTRLTGITEAAIDAEGQPLATALGAVARFAAGAPMWSWGKDEFVMVAIACYVAGIAPPLPARQFANARSLLHKAGMTEEEIAATSSGRLAEHFGVGDPATRAHDALDDALSVATVLQHLLRAGRLAPSDLA